MVLDIWRLDVDSTFEKIDIIDTATSVIWIERYQDLGQFELYISALPRWVDEFTNNEIFITKQGSSCAMYVESVKLRRTPKEGDYPHDNRQERRGDDALALDALQ